jgi:hypothetical protein
LELASLLGRELSQAEVSGLGWGGSVPLSQIKHAAEFLGDENNDMDTGRKVSAG